MSDTQKLFSGFLPVEDVCDRLDRKASSQDEPARMSQTDGRVKTRFLNFRFARTVAVDDGAAAPAARADRDPAVLASLTVVGGAGLGTVFELDKQVVQIGRDEGQDVRLDFGDTAVSRRCHASITWYGTGNFAIRDGLKPNPVLLNRKTLTGEDRLRDGDLIQVGETVLRFRIA